MMSLAQQLKRMCEELGAIDASPVSSSEQLKVGDQVIFKKGTKYEDSIAVVVSIINDKEVDLKFGGGGAMLGQQKVSDLLKYDDDPVGKQE